MSNYQLSQDAGQFSREAVKPPHVPARRLWGCLVCIWTWSFLAAWMLLPLQATAQQPAASPLWGELAPGPYRTGFRAIYRFDRSRTWRTTRPFEMPFSPDRDGRPIRINMWYPAAPDKSARQMHWADYVHMAAPEGFAALNEIVEQRDRRISALSVPDGQVPALLGTPVMAYADAPRAGGRSPVILYWGGLNDATMSGIIMAEFLASHGYIVATIPILGPTDQETFQLRTPADLETTVRDMEFAWSVLREEANVDEGKLGTMGYSVGGIEAFIFAMRNANVGAAVGLDGTYGFEGASKVLTDFYDYAPQNMRGAFLDLRRPDGDQGSTLDLSAVHALRYVDRYLVTMKKMHHSDFGTFATVAHVFHLGNEGWVEKYGWTRETGYRGFQAVCGIVRDFLDEKLKGDPQAAVRLKMDVARAEGGTFSLEKAQPIPPYPAELVTLISRRGFEAGTAIIGRYRGDVPLEKFIDEKTYNSVGYDFINSGRPADAVIAFRIVTYAHPKSANACDSLADGYIAAGDKANARLTLGRAIELVAADPDYDAENKKSFADAERAKIAKLEH